MGFRVVPASLKLPRRTVLVVLLLALQTLALRLVDSVATVGYVTELGAARLPWVWVGELLLTLLAGATYLRVADRWPRALLVRRLFVFGGAGYLLCGLLLLLGCSPVACYAFAYIWSAQQLAVLPMALWTLANDVHGAADKARLFPRIAAGESIGHLAGYGLTAWVGSQLEASRTVDFGLLAVAAGLLLTAALFVNKVLGEGGGAALPEVVHGDTDVSTAPEVPPDTRLWPLALSVVFGWIAMTIIVFHTMASLESAARIQPAGLRTLYAAYNLGLTLLTLGAQWIAGRLLARQRLEAAFVALPAIMAIGLFAVLPWPGLSGAFMLSAAMYLVHDAWDMPARHAWLGRVPTAKRGRATALLDNHAFVAGSVVASVALGILCFNVTAAAVRAPLYLTFGALAALASLLAARQMVQPRHRVTATGQSRVARAPS